MSRKQKQTDRQTNKQTKRNKQRVGLAEELTRSLTGNTTVTKTGNCQITVSFDDDDAKSISLTLNQDTSLLSQTLIGTSSGPNGPGLGLPGDDGPPRGPPPGLAGLLGLKGPDCYDCDGVERDCRELEHLKAELVITTCFPFI